ncbi:MAG: hypothetical protein K9N05_00935 [Candidatus Marinimicrobia bacterium]|nr:hypothetical protein [Candidatus Neomarinimicrobiota bacterium]
MKKKTMKIFLYISTIMMVMLIFSCKNMFAPTLGDLDGGNSIYRIDQASPADVLHNFKYAYIYRDSLIYANLIDSEFVFVYYQPSDESGTGHYDSWMRSVELRSTGRFLSAFNYIDLIWQTTLDSAFYEMDGDEVITERDTLFANANIADISKSYQLTLGDYTTLIGDAAFRFRKGYDGKWRILRWEDKYNSY